MNKKNQKGLSLIEILVVISVFAVLGIIVSISIMSTLKSARKSESQITVRENLNYAVSVIERQIRGAEKIEPCPNASDKVLSYIAGDRIQASFSCLFPSNDGYVSSGSARLTSQDIILTDCSFSCLQTDFNSPPKVIVNLSAKNATNQQAEGSQVSIQTEISLRNY